MLPQYFHIMFLPLDAICFLRCTRPSSGRAPPSPPHDAPVPTPAPSLAPPHITVVTVMKPTELPSSCNDIHLCCSIFFRGRVFLAPQPVHLSGGRACHLGARLHCSYREDVSVMKLWYKFDGFSSFTQKDICLWFNRRAEMQISTTWSSSCHSVDVWSASTPMFLIWENFAVALEHRSPAKRQSSCT